MDLIDLFQRLGLAIAIGAAIGVERHWREREEPDGARIAGIRTFTLIGMTGGLAGLIETSLGSSALPGLVVAAFLIAVSSALLRFALLEAEGQNRFSATTVIAAIAAFALGVLAVLGDMVIASAAGAATVVVLSSREFLHQSIRRLTWPELRSAVLLLAMGFLLLPLIPSQPYGPFGGVSPRSLVVLVIILASISFIGYVAVRLLGPGQGNLVAGAVGGLVSSTATTLAFAQRSVAEGSAAGLAAGAVAAGGVSLIRTGFLVVALAPSLASELLPSLLLAGVAMGGAALLLARRGGAVVEGENKADPPANPFELVQVVRMALLIAVIAFLARAGSSVFGDRGLYVVSALSALADVDAATVTVSGMLDRVSGPVASHAIGIAVIANMLAKAGYAVVAGSRPFAVIVCVVSAIALGVGLLAPLTTGLL
ncbi:MgtC/SapB family protein [Rhizobium sp. G187]|uniref:MgtC/SapB family protein n=1 Tax=Rhizobium sp. G187 TaxID=3451352 RepID=UPI003EE4719B